MILATTNRPWDIDEAMRRRLEKRIYVGLPDTATRKAMLKIYLKPEEQPASLGDRTPESSSKKNISIANDVNLDAIVAATEGYSGADIRMLCREAAMMPMRRLLEGKSAQEVLKLRSSGSLEKVGDITETDFEVALQNTKPSVAQSEEAVEKFKKWEHEFGSK